MAEIEVLFSDRERWRLIQLLVQGAIGGRDPELVEILTKLEGVDTVLVARRYDTRIVDPELLKVTS